MNTPIFARIARQNQQGFTLVELMVALTIGLIVLAVVGTVYLSSRQSFRLADSMSRMQENARLAIETMARDVRMAGYVGCGNLQTATVTTIANAPVPAISSANAITGLDSGASTANYLGTTITRPDGDTISVMGAFGNGASIDDGPSSNANLKIVGNPESFVKDEVLMATNCTNADVFNVTNSPGGGGTSTGIVTLTHAGGNTGNRVGNYGKDGIVFRIRQFTYFIGINPANKRALYRTNLTTGVPEGTVELVEDVENMQIRYGRDTNGDGAADSYDDATTVGTSWAQVVSARISLLLVSPENNIALSPQTYNFNGAPVLAGDRRLYQVLTSTIAVRNRAP